ncbi:MAG: twin-arginine translocase TatA/TatE family subunit [Bacteroidales bacterium]
MGTLLFVSGQEIFVIMLVVLLLFGADKIPEIARGIGKGMRDFRKATDEIRREIEESTREIRKEMTEVGESLTRDATEVANNVQRQVDDATSSINNDLQQAADNLQKSVDDMNQSINQSGPSTNDSANYSYQDTYNYDRPVAQPADPAVASNDAETPVADDSTGVKPEVHDQGQGDPAHSVS